MIAVVDYKKGNLLSVERGLRAVGADARITADVADIAVADAIVLPGVGAFADAAATMEELGQMQAIRDRLAQGVPFLGICLGLHLLFEEGTEGAGAAAGAAEGVGLGGAGAAAGAAAGSGANGEGNSRGLGVLPGCVDRMPATDASGNAFKVPHVGWNTVDFDAESDASDVCPLFEGIDPGTYFYFTHSYISPDSAATVARTTHSTTFPCAVQQGNIFGTQFHPEKSSDAGARVLQNFVNFAKGAC